MCIDQITAVSSIGLAERRRLLPPLEAFKLLVVEGKGMECEIHESQGVEDSDFI